MQNSSAYDLSAYEPRRQRGAEKAEEKPRVQLIVGKSAAEIRRPKVILQCALVTAILTSILCMMLYSNAILTELSDSIAVETQKSTILVSESNRMQAEIQGKMSLRSIEDVAKNELGLSELEPYQVTYVNRTDGDKMMRNAEAGKKSSPLSGVSDTISSVLEYLRISFNKN